MLPFFPEEQQAEIARRLLAYFDERVANLTNVEIKDIDIDTLKILVTDSIYIFKKAYRLDEIDRFLEEKQKLLVVKFVRSQ
jgi:hypothetical protein